MRSARLELCCRAALPERAHAMRERLQAEIFQSGALSFARRGERHRRMRTVVLQALLAGGLACACAQVLAEAAIKAQEGNVQNWIEYYERERARNLQRSEPTREVTGLSAGPEADRSSDPAPRQDASRDSRQAR